ncbi:MAG TPA: glycosyltransferase [Vicinamibacterales bacterium]|jgi:glycosyltransferase involved in cell wall biosynthesis|nr:glycosyltransferase [Vicinamibacterales bacterium]
MRHVVVMITTSYPRFPGDGVGSFIEPIAKGVAARGHEVHLVAPWHPALTRGREEDGVFFHFFRYALTPSMNVFGYASSLHADTQLKLAAWLATPSALAAGTFKAMRVAQKRRATVVHAHWAVPGGVIGSVAAGGRPLVVSLHGSDVFVAERRALVGRAAHHVFKRAEWITACSDDLHRRAVVLGAPADRIETLPYGVDVARFAPSPATRTDVRRRFDLGEGPVIFGAGRLVSKKGFEVLIDAVLALRATMPDARVVIAGDGDLRADLERRAAPLGARVLLGTQPQDEIGRLAAAADVVAVPSVHDEAGNVDGLPNVALEALATGTPVVASRVGGLPQAIEDGVTGLLVPEQDARALADALGRLLRDRPLARRLGTSAREAVTRRFGWPHVAERLETIYDAVATRRPLSRAGAEEYGDGAIAHDR